MFFYHRTLGSLAAVTFLFTLTHYSSEAQSPPPFDPSLIPVIPQYLDIQLQENFDSSRYVGKWYDIYHSNGLQNFEAHDTDISSSYSLNPNGSANVLFRIWDTEDNQWEYLQGLASPAEATRPRFMVAVPGLFSIDYRVLYTDYDSISVVYSNNLILSQTMELGWILARTPNVSQSLIDYAFQIFQSRGTNVTTANMNKTVHGVAPVSSLQSSFDSAGGMPAAVATNLQIELQANFNIRNYVGRWFEVYRTKGIPFQGGTDTMVVYTLRGDGSVSVVNMQWLPASNKWDQIKGYAVAAEKYRPRFTVTFPGLPSGDYRVLYTDYFNVAVVFSDELFMGLQVKYCWILVRSLKVSDDIINAAIDLYVTRTGVARGALERTKHDVADTHFIPA